MCTPSAPDYFWTKSALARELESASTTYKSFRNNPNVGSSLRIDFLNAAKKL
jgi:hypothetical protein